MAARIVAYLVACIVGVTLIAGLIVRAQREDDGAVDLIVVNGKVYAADGQESLNEAVAVRGNKVIRVGSTREIQRLRRAQTIVIDARGGAVVPGFNDAHTHFISGGLALDQVNLLDAMTLDAVKDTVRVWAESHPERDWIVGRGWYYQPFAGGLPDAPAPRYAGSRSSRVPDRLRRPHRAGPTPRRCSSRASRGGPRIPLNGVIVKDPRSGEPTGVS